MAPIETLLKLEFSTEDDRSNPMMVNKLSNSKNSKIATENQVTKNDCREIQLDTIIFQNFTQVRGEDRSSGNRRFSTEARSMDDAILHIQLWRVTLYFYETSPFTTALFRPKIAAVVVFLLETLHRVVVLGHFLKNLQPPPL